MVVARYGIVDVRRDVHGIVGEGVCRVRQKEGGNCDGRDLDSSFVIWP
jgi:hypothetical protein